MPNIKNKTVDFIENEVWKKIHNSNGYFISNLGRVKRHKYYKTTNEHVEYLLVPTKRGKKINSPNSSSYYCVGIWYNDNKYKRESIHRLIAIAFIPNPENKCCVNHIDGNTYNNSIDNLEWVTNEENLKHRFSVLKKYNNVKGDLSHFSKLKEEQVRFIPKLLEKGFNKRQIAQILATSESTILEITNGRSWQYLKLFPYKKRKSSVNNRFENNSL